MPPDRTFRTRQEPVSCQLCRSRKLKCSREFPCSNCQARGVTCVFRGSRPPEAQSQALQGAVTNSIDLVAENAAIKARLAKLEQILLDERPPSGNRTGSSTTGLVAPSSPTLRHFSPDSEDGFTFDTRFLEHSGTREGASFPPPQRVVELRTLPLHELCEAQSTTAAPAVILRLPPSDLTSVLLEDYIEHLDAVQHVIYVPKVRQLILALYESTGRHTNSDLGAAALILSILASMSYYWTLGFGDRSTFPSPSSAMQASMSFFNDALDAIEYVRRTTAASIETCQCTIILLFMLYHLESFSPRVRFLHTTALAMARDLGIHRIDSQEIKYKSQQHIIETELSRRVWWHIAATDWSLSNTPGPQEGLYSVQPSHMKVNLPRNISDEDLLMQASNFERPLTEPTIMAYYLQRVRLAEVCRAIIDTTWEGSVRPHPRQQDYDVILSLDGRFQKMLQELPFFLRLDATDTEACAQVDRAHRMVPMQRQVVNLMIRVCRCKLHLPFLGLVPQNSKYGFSRNICLQAAREILGDRNVFGDEQTASSLAQSRLCGVLHLVFYAVVVLVMDLCINRPIGTEDAHLKAEVRRGCEILEDANDRSSVAHAFLESLMAILKKHEVNLATSGNYATPSISATDRNLLPPTSSEMLWADPTMPVNSTSEFGDIWTNYLNFGGSLDPQDWSSIFADLETRIG